MSNCTEHDNTMFSIMQGKCLPTQMRSLKQKSKQSARVEWFYQAQHKQSDSLPFIFHENAQCVRVQWHSSQKWGMEIENSQKGSEARVWRNNRDLSGAISNWYDEVVEFNQNSYFAYNSKLMTHFGDEKFYSALKSERKICKFNTNFQSGEDIRVTHFSMLYNRSECCAESDACQPYA